MKEWVSLEKEEQVKECMIKWAKNFDYNTFPMGKKIVKRIKIHIVL